MIARWTVIGLALLGSVHAQAGTGEAQPADEVLRPVEFDAVDRTIGALPELVDGTVVGQVLIGRYFEAGNVGESGLIEWPGLNGLTTRIPAATHPSGFLTVDLEFIPKDILGDGIRWRPAIEEALRSMAASAAELDHLELEGYVVASTEVRKFIWDCLHRRFPATIGLKDLRSIWLCERNRAIRDFRNPWRSWDVIIKSLLDLEHPIYAKVMDRGAYAELEESVRESLRLERSTVHWRTCSQLDHLARGLVRQTSASLETLDFGALSIGFPNPARELIAQGRKALPALYEVLQSEAASRCVERPGQSDFHVVSVGEVAKKVVETILDRRFDSCADARSFLRENAYSRGQ